MRAGSWLASVRTGLELTPDSSDWQRPAMAMRGACRWFPPPLSRRADGRRASSARLASNDPASLANDNQLIGVDPFHQLGRAARPRDLQSVDARPVAEPDNDPQVVLCIETSAAPHLID